MDGDPDTGEGADAGEQQRPAPTGMTRDEYHAKERAAFLAGAGQDEPIEDAPEKPADKPKPKKIIGAPVDEDAEDGDEEPVVEPTPDADEDPEDDEPDEADDEPADDEEDDEDKVAAKDDADPELAKRREAMRQTERRQRASLARDRAAFEAERATWQAQSKAVTDAQKRFDEMAARVNYNPLAVLVELGLRKESYLRAAQYIAAHTDDPAAGVTPAHRAAAEKAMREAEAADKAASAEKRVEKLEQTLAQREQQAAADRELDVLFRRTFKKADDTAPRVKALVAADPGAARAELEVTAFELAQKLQRLPKPSEIVAAHEKKIARQLKRYGVDTGAAAKPATKKPDTTEAAKPGAKPAPTKPKPTTDPALNGMHVLPTRVVIPSRDEIVKELEELS